MKIWKKVALVINLSFKLSVFSITGQTEPQNFIGILPSFPNRSPVYLKNNEDADSLVNETVSVKNKSPEKRNSITKNESGRKNSSTSTFNNRGGPRFSSSLSLEEIESFWRKLMRKCCGMHKFKQLKIRIAFGNKAEQEFDKKFCRNIVTTTKYFFCF